MKLEMARESCRKPCLNEEGRGLRQCIFDVVACLGDGISIIIASKSICLRLENSRRGVAACVKDAYAPPEGLQGPPPPLYGDAETARKQFFRSQR